MGWLESKPKCTLFTIIKSFDYVLFWAHLYYFKQDFFCEVYRDEIEIVRFTKIEVFTGMKFIFIALNKENVRLCLFIGGGKRNIFFSFKKVRLLPRIYMIHFGVQINLLCYLSNH